MKPKQPNSRLIWPPNAKADPSMSYLALDLLFNETTQEIFGNKFSLIAVCATDISLGHNEQVGVVHKIDVNAMPNVSQASLEITHEVCPGLKSASRVVTINEHVKAIGFDTGAVVFVSNFGPKKTFNCDVRGRLEHHGGEISCLAANSAGSMLASGCTAGTITLYQARDAEITFLTKTQETRAEHITDMHFYQASNDFPFGSMKRESSANDYLLLYSATNGQMGLIDTRCKLAERAHSELMFIPDPRVNITSFAIDSKSNHVVYIGTNSGELLLCDLRFYGRTILRQKNQDDNHIGRLKEFTIHDGANLNSFIAYTNGTENLQILDVETLKPHKKWLRERAPEGKVRDFVKIEDRLMTCGDRTSIGCWTWDRPAISADGPGDE